SGVAGPARPSPRSRDPRSRSYQPGAAATSRTSPSPGFPLPAGRGSPGAEVGKPSMRVAWHACSRDSEPSPQRGERLDILLLLLGAVLLAVVVVDALWTTLWVDGGA